MKEWRKGGGGGWDGGMGSFGEEVAALLLPGVTIVGGLGMVVVEDEGELSDAIESVYVTLVLLEEM